MAEVSNLLALPRGTRLRGGAYAVGEVLGQGGFGITYKGGDLALRRYVAIKEFFPAGAIRRGSTVVPHGANQTAHDQGRQAFLQEAATLARFEHPGIVRVLETFEENNSAYMVMEFLEGQTLGQRLRSVKTMDEWEVLDIGVKLCQALQIVHDEGLLHRDIKPENIVLAPNSRAVLIDFGTARAFGAGTQAMTQLLTPGYAPLEQYASQARRGPTTDVYALGATLYHALTGRQPVAATDRAADVPLPHIRDLRPMLTPIVSGAIMRALEMEVGKRPQSAEAFSAQLKGLAAPTRINTAVGSTVKPPLSHPSGAAAPNSATDASVILHHSKLERHTLLVHDLSFDPTSTRLATAGHDRIACLWNWQIGGVSSIINGHEQAVTCLAFSPDGTWLVTGSTDQTVRVWDVARPTDGGQSHLTQDFAPRNLVVLRDTKGVVLDLAFCLTRRAFAVGDAGCITLWDAATGQIAARREMAGSKVAWSPDGTLLATAQKMDGVLYLLDGTTLQTRGSWAAQQSEVTGIAFSPDGSRLATCGGDGFVRVWNATDGQLLWEHCPSPSACAAVAWSPDSQLLASASREVVSLWTRRGELWRRYLQHKDRVMAVEFAPNPVSPYRYVLGSVSRDKTVGICRIIAGAAPV